MQELMDKASAICKKELLYYFPLGPLLWLGGIVFIDRMNPKTAIKKLEATAHYLSGKKVSKTYLYLILYDFKLFIRFI